MNDKIWFIVTGILFVILCIVFVRLGWLIRQKQRTDLIISHHRGKVSEENKKAYCDLFGSGLLIMGAGFGLSGIFLFFTGSLLTFIPMTAGLITGIIQIISSVVKYNR